MKNGFLIDGQFKQEKLLFCCWELFSLFCFCPNNNRKIYNKNEQNSIQFPPSPWFRPERKTRFHLLAILMKRLQHNWLCYSKAEKYKKERNVFSKKKIRKEMFIIKLSINKTFILRKKMGNKNKATIKQVRKTTSSIDEWKHKLIYFIDFGYQNIVS